MYNWFFLSVFLFFSPLLWRQVGGEALFSQNWQPLGSGMDNAVRCLFVDTISNELYAGGNFKYAGGKQVYAIAKWDGTQWDSLGSGAKIDTTSAPFPILAITKFQGELYAGGMFKIMGGKTVNGIAKWNGVQWDSTGKGVILGMNNGTVTSFHVNNNILYVAGWFDTINDVPASQIAKWDGTSWSAIDTTKWVSGVINTITFYNGELYVGGNMVNWDGTMDRIARWNGVNWLPVGNGIKGSLAGITSFETFNGELYVGGRFNTSDGNPGNAIAKWDGSQWFDVGGGMTSMNATVWDMQVFNNQLYAVGGFLNAGGVPAQYIAVWDGVQWCGLGSAFDNVILTGCFYKDTLYIGGGFWTIDGDSMNYIARWTGGSYVDTCGNTSGINENNFSFQINIYPNPSNGIFTIQSSEKISSIEMYNVLGEKIYSTIQPFDHSTIDISTRPKGIYFIKVINRENIYTEKIIIQ